MDDLNKTQVLLLTLFVSFVTSIATGIVTVTLLEQAPVGVTQTINRVVEHTVERITPGESKTTIKEVLVSGEDLVAKAAQESKLALVRIKASFAGEEGDYEKIVTGVVVGNEGYIVSSRELQASSKSEVVVVSPSGMEAKAQIMAVGEGEASIVKLEKAAAIKLIGLSLASKEPELGDLLMALGYQGKNTALHLGRIIKVDDSDASSTPIFVTDLSSDWPLLFTNGKVAGFGKKDGKMVPAGELANLVKAATSGIKVSSSHTGQTAELIGGVLGSAPASTTATTTPVLTNP